MEIQILILFLCSVIVLGQSISYENTLLRELRSRLNQDNQSNCSGGYRQSTPFTAKYSVGVTYQCISCGQTCCRKKSRAVEQTIGKRIRNGNKAKRGQFPWSVAIFKWNSNLNGWKFICGGVLLSEDKIATAAHCIPNEDFDGIEYKLRVTIGENNIYIDPQTGKRVKRFPLLKELKATGSSRLKKPTLSTPGHKTGDIRGDDLAILTLADPVDTPRICLRPSKTFPENPVCHGIGHGYSGQEKRLSKRLQFTRVHLDFSNRCLESLSNGHMLCATGPEEKTASCKMDSGSPVVCQIDPDDECSSYYLAGIFSFMQKSYNGHCNGNFSVLTNVLNKAVEEETIYSSVSNGAKLEYFQDLDGIKGNQKCTSMLKKFNHMFD